MTLHRLAFTLAFVSLCRIAAAQEHKPSPEAEFSAKARIDPTPSSPDESSRAQSRVTQKEMRERIASSAPDALRYEPGVYIQQTAHGQASPYVRGLTGQQVLLMFDGVRLNNGIYRQGPNQYFFTVDNLTIDTIDVIRGSASTRYGSDALGGAILATPISAPLDRNNHGLRWHPKLTLRTASQDLEIGGRAQMGASIANNTAIVGGVGYRDVGQLESGGKVSNSGFSDPLVPRFEEDGRTQMGTGFREATFDLRAEHQISRSLKVVGALYGFRQLDAPRTDQCPAAEAPDSECLWIDKQFRTLSYLSLRSTRLGDLRDTRLTVSYQRYDEHRRRERPRSFIRHNWNDTVDTFGLAFRSKSKAFALSDITFIRVRFGFEALNDKLNSNASTTFTDLEEHIPLSRGLYVEGSRYFTLGAFTELELYANSWLTFYGGGRASWIGARVPRDDASDTQAVNENFSAFVGRFGADAQINEAISVFMNVDQGFRAPNLDDLSARTQIGPGFQFENADLTPERSTTIELGVREKSAWLRLDAWVFATILDDAITRIVRDASTCPPETPACASSRARFQLVNADESSVILGSEGAATLFLPEQISVRTSASYAWGEGPNLSSSLDSGRVPLSRVPPLNGTVETRWQIFDTRFFTALAMRWALAQHRLAPSDRSDPRIPPGGTPAYTVFDLRAGWTIRKDVYLNLILENIFDEAYRVHGSSINGPGRGIRAAFSAAW